jgi:DNA-binding transcriptional LysR family regulator
MNKIKEIEAFVSAIEKGSLARAAQQHDVTPAMLGRRIDALEARLGVKLMHRTTRHLLLTEQGALFLDSCHKILTDLEFAEKGVSEGRHKATGFLSVFAPAAFGRQHVAPHAKAFIAAHPGVQVNFNLTTQQIDLVRDRYDVGIRIGREIDPSFVAIKLAPNRRVVCGSPEYFKEFGIPRTPDDLAQHNCLAFNAPPEHNSRWRFQSGGKLFTIKVNGTIGCNDGELLTRWAREGLGVAWRSTWEIQRYLDSGQLVTVLDAFSPPNYHITAVYPQQPHLPAKVRFFIDELRFIYALPGYWSSSSLSND